MNDMEKLIDAETEKQLKIKFTAGMKGTVDVKVFTNPIITPGDTQTAEINAFAKQIVRELSALDARIIAQDLGMADAAAKSLGITTSPSVAIGYDLGYRIIYNGAPLGYEVAGLIETIVLASQRDSGLNQDNRKAVALIDKDTLFQVFVTPTCPYCPQSVLAANRIAIESKGKVTAECVESAENQALAAKFNVSSVPQQVVNGIAESVTIGAMPVDKLVKQVLKYGAPEKYEPFEKQEQAERALKEKLEDSPKGTVYITDGNFGEAVKKYENLVLDCWAEWCTPCKMLSPVIEALAAEYAGKIVFGKLNTDENPKTASENAIQSIPTLLVFKKGALKGSVIGVQPKQELELKLKELLGI
jgi:thioredoxin 1